MKKALKIGGGIIGALLLLLLGYVIYVFAAYDRIEDQAQKHLCLPELPSISLRGI